MSEKVLGFQKKDAEFHLIGEEGLPWAHIRIGDDKLVPVRLCSESVDLKEHKQAKRLHQKIVDGLNKAHQKDTEFLIKLKHKIQRESVSTKWLEKWCKENGRKVKLCGCGYKGDVVQVSNLLAVVCGRAKEEKISKAEHAAELFGIGGRPTKKERAKVVKLVKEGK